MAYGTALEYLVSKLKEEREIVSEHAVRGNGVSDYAAYQRLCGIVQGLDFATTLINDLAKRLEEDADE
jgi:hypothetical protein